MISDWFEAVGLIFTWTWAAGTEEKASGVCDNEMFSSRGWILQQVLLSMSSIKQCPSALIQEQITLSSSDFSIITDLLATKRALLARSAGGQTAPPNG